MRFRRTAVPATERAVAVVLCLVHFCTNRIQGGSILMPVYASTLHLQLPRVRARYPTPKGVVVSWYQ